MEGKLVLLCWNGSCSCGDANGSPKVSKQAKKNCKALFVVV